MALATLDDFLGLEARLQKRIEQEVPDLSDSVRLVNDTADVIQKARAVTVWIAPGPSTLQADRAGRALDCTQRWDVVVAVRNVASMDSGRPARAQAGPIISRLLAALSGWHPGAPYGLLRAVNPPAPPFSEQGVFFYPLAFETRFAFMATTPLENAS